MRFDAAAGLLRVCTAMDIVGKVIIGLGLLVALAQVFQGDLHGVWAALGVSVTLAAPLFGLSWIFRGFVKPD